MGYYAAEPGMVLIGPYGEKVTLTKGIFVYETCEIRDVEGVKDGEVPVWLSAEIDRLLELAASKRV